MSYPQLLVEAAFTASAAESGLGYMYLDDPFRGLLDTGTLADEIWADITPYVRALTISRGSSRFDGPTVRYEAGRCTVVLDNRDRRFDPTWTTGPYAVSGVSQVTPMRAVRIRATYGAATYALFRGFADAWDITWPTKTVSRGDSVCTLTATDATKVLANFDGPAQTPAGAGEDAGARVSRVLDNVGWSATDRAIDVGDTLMQATDLDDTALTELQDTADAEGGEIYVRGDGSIVFRHRRALITDTRSSTSQAVFGDGPGELRYQDITLSYDDAQLRNYVTVTREGGVDQVAQDTDSQNSYLTHTWAESGLPMQSDADALNLAQWVLSQSAEPELRFSTLTVNPRHDEDLLFPEVLGRELGDRVTVRRRPVWTSSSGSLLTYDDASYGYDSVDSTYDGVAAALIARDVFIRGITHEASPKHWVTTWAFQSATKYSFLVLDDAILGVLDSNNLSF